MREWFTTKEKLPELNTRILFTTDKLVGHIGEYKDGIFSDETNSYRVEEVQAWSYLSTKK